MAPVPQFHARLLDVGERYPAVALDHRLVNVDAGLFPGGVRARMAPAGAHSDFARPESAHLMLSLAAMSR